MPQYPKKELAQLVVQRCLREQVRDVVISPGSRNAPLIIGFTNHPEMETYSVVDERSAAFFALGMAQQTRKPVAVVCTSGSALLNYYPAVAEAYYSRIPLVVISADRPPHLIDIADGQTIRQENVFQNHILFSASLKELDKNSSRKEVDQQDDLIKKALKIAAQQKGPVHINVPFDEPLYEVSDTMNLKLQDDPEVPVNSLLDEEPLDEDELQQFADIWNKSRKKMVLAGVNFPDDMLQVQMNHIVKDAGVLVLTETTSNLHHGNFINSIDKLIAPLSEAELKELQPEILLTFGGMVVSKKIKQFLRKYPPKHHWHIDRFVAPDTYHHLTHHFKVSPQLFFSQFFFLTEPGEGIYQKKWLDKKAARIKKHDLFLKNAPFSDLQVFETVLSQLPEKAILQLANSSVVRYTQLFDLKKELRVFCNRGTSGIDGSSSTAVGAALKRDEQTVLITGDISFFYDSNALWNKYLKSSFRIVLINNSGGGIFRFIPGPAETNALEYFETPNHLNAKPLCDLYGLEYSRAATKEELTEKLSDFFDASEKPRLLEIFTPSTKNDRVLKDYFKELK